MFAMPPRKHSSNGFTLIEILVAIAVTSLLVVMAAQLTSSTTSTTTDSRKHLDADSQARLIFDRMEYDFSRMLKRDDVDCVFNIQPGNDSAYFYSEVPGYFSGTSNQSPISLVGYRITSLKLERLGKALTWDGQSIGTSTPGSVVFLTHSSGTAADFASTLKGGWPDTVKDDSSDADFHLISDEVYRLEFAFLLKTGTLTTQFSKLSNVSAIVVSIAILDSTSQKMIPTSNNLVSALEDASDAKLTSSPPKTTVSVWHDAANSKDFAQKCGIPAAAASQVRIYQRYFYLKK
jgi:prepilin-type N-terminal cleavage/methylation domain-containing protein